MQCATHPGVETELRCASLLLLLVLGIVGGRLIGEAMSYSSGWKRGPRLAGVAAGTVVVGILVGGPLVVRLWYGIPAGVGDLWRGMAALPALWLLAALTTALGAYWRIR
jgi:hypothetical protein